MESFVYSKKPSRLQFVSLSPPVQTPLTTTNANTPCQILILWHKNKIFLSRDCDTLKMLLLSKKFAWPFDPISIVLFLYSQ